MDRGGGQGHGGEPHPTAFFHPEAGELGLHSHPSLLTRVVVVIRMLWQILTALWDQDRMTPEAQG